MYDAFRITPNYNQVTIAPYRYGKMTASENDYEKLGISNSDSIELPVDQFREFLETCEQNEEPNQELKGAFKAAKERGFE